MYKPGIEQGTLGIAVQILYNLSYEVDAQLGVSHSYLLVRLQLQHKMGTFIWPHELEAYHETQINPESLNTYLNMMYFSINYQLSINYENTPEVIECLICDNHIAI